MHFRETFFAADASARAEGRPRGGPRITSEKPAPELQRRPERLYFVLEHGGRDLFAHLTERKVAGDVKVDAAAARPVLAQLAAGVAALVENRVVHHDVKTENVLVEERPDGSLHVRLTDLGLAEQYFGGAETMF